MIQEKDFLYRVPVKTAPITTPRGQIRNPEILVDLEGGEFMHGNILDANSTNKLVNQSVKEAVDNKLNESGYVTKDLLEAETTRATEQENSLKTLIDAETSARTKGDEELNQAITEKADASALANEVARATGVESGLQAAIATKADATALSNYVLTTALNKQVDTLNAAISAKQDAGSYIPYDQDDGKKYTLQKGLELGDGENTVTINKGGMDIRIFENRVALGTKIIGSNGDDSFSIDCDNIRLHNMGREIAISPIGISSVTDEDTTLFNIGSTTIILGPTNNPNVKISEEGIKFKGKTNSYIPTADGDFIELSSLASEEDISSLRVGLSKKQNKITVNTVDIDDIETADVTKLRTIVTNLINALSSSGLINATYGIE